jgi:hypothetical protein
VIPFDTDARDPAVHESLQNKILTAIVEILNAHEASVTALRPPKDSRRGSQTPTSFLIYNISPEQANILLDSGVWSSRVVTFRVAPFAAISPSFFFAIKGFRTIAKREIYLIVRKVWESNETKDFIDKLLIDIRPANRPLITHDLETLIYSVNLT